LQKKVKLHIYANQHENAEVQDTEDEIVICPNFTPENLEEICADVLFRYSRMIRSALHVGSNSA
jgi:hypothetical protein